MSALAGIWRLDEEPDARKSCARMLSAQRIYGPHAVACWNGGFVAMGRALFRLVHEDRFDRQPLIGEVGQLVLVADLRLDNRDELADALEIDRDRRRTLCDAAILLAAYDRWSEACLDRIVGDYAFALYDARRRRLLLARDPLGQRPLHYHCGRNLFAFASMPKGLHALPGIPREVDEERVAEFLVLLPESGPRTFYREIARVEPGHLLAFDGSGISSRRYWEPKRVTLVLKHPRDYVEGLREQVDRATRARLRGAEAAVGAHLSAGLDSSIVAGTAARQLAAAGGRVIAFTGAPQEGYAADPRETRIADESGHAAATAAMHANVDHVVVRAGPISPLQDIDRYPFLFDQPLLNLCNTGWMHAINAAARERGLNVMLNGIMGNFTLSYHGMQYLPDLLRSGRWLRWSRAAFLLARNGGCNWRGILGSSLGPFVPAAIWQWVYRALRRDGRDVTSYSAIDPQCFAALDLAARARGRALDFHYRPRKDVFATRLWALRRVDPGNWNKGTLAGWGIDQRDPTADRRLIEYCLSIPATEFLSGGVMRALARRSFADRVPAVVLDEPRRGRQGADWHEGFKVARQQVSEEIARLDRCTAAARIIDLKRLHRLVEDWPERGWEGREIAVAYRTMLLRALSGGHFLRRAAGQNG